jgi:hypothetical protein
MSMFDFSGVRTLNTGDSKFFFYSVDKQNELFKMNFKGLDMFFTSLDLLGKDGIGHAMILFDGYNDTAKELYEVPQIRKFVKELFKRYPHVLNYVNFDLEGEKHLLASLLDVEAVFRGEKMTFAQHNKKYGIGTPMPRYDMRIHMDKERMREIMTAMFVHGNQLGVAKYTDKQVERLMKIF